MKFLIYRYNPETDAEPRMQEHMLAEMRFPPHREHRFRGDREQ